MIVSVLAVTVLAGAVFGRIAPRLSRALPPVVATWFMSAGGLLAAAATTTALALVSFPMLARTAPLTEQGHWSDAVLAHREPVSTPLAVAAMGVLAVVLMSAVRCAVGRTRSTVAAYRLAAEVGGGELRVLDAPEPSALAVPGRPGRILVTSGMLRRLDPGERRALLEHERAHLRHRHHLHQTATALAVALNPLLWPLRAAVGLSCERWADEDAAAACRRRTVAQALLHAAGGPRSAAQAVMLRATGSNVAARVAALDAPAPRLRMFPALVLVSVLATALVALADGLSSTERIFELAQAAWRATHH